MSEEPTLYPLEFEDPAEFQTAWSTIVSLASVFVPGPELAPQTPVVVEIAAAGVGKAKLRGAAAFVDVDSYGRKGVVVTLDVNDLADARAVFEAGHKPGFATTMLKAASAIEPAGADTRPPAAAPSPPEGHDQPAERLEAGTLLP